MLGSNDRAPFRVAGRDITTETTYEGDAIPQVWQVFDSLTNPSIVASGTFYTNNADKPDRVQFLSWGNAYYEDRWDYTTYNEGIGDSGVTVTFDPDTLAPGESKTVKTFYGISAFTPSETDPDGEIGFSAIAPRELLLNETGNSYLGNPFTFNSWVSNTGNATLSNVSVSISLPEGLYTENENIFIGDLAAGDDFNAAWMISATPERYDRTLEYSVMISSDGNDPIISDYSIFLPATQASPIRVEADREGIAVGSTVDVFVTTENLPPVDALAIVPIFDTSVFELVDAEWLMYAEIQDIDLERGRAVSAWADPTYPEGQVFRFTLSAIGECYDTVISADIITQIEGVLEYLTVEPATVDAFVCYHEDLEIVPQNNDVHLATCRDCGLTFEQEHSFEITTVDPTCTSEGYTSYYCAGCGDTFIYDVIEAPGHDYVVNRVSPPTCVNYGYTEYVCTRCGDLYADDIIESPGHVYESEVFEPTCMDQGFTRFTCTGCGTWYDDNYTPVIPHNYEITDTAEPTCMADGYTVYTCTECYDSYTDYIPALAHSYEETVFAPTCQASGYTVYTCTACGYSYEGNYVSPIEHSYEVTEVIEATCNTQGYTVYTCTVCGDVFNSDYRPVIAHDIVMDRVVAPTCWDEGYTVYKCLGCGFETFRDYVPSLPHNFEDRIVDPTCLNPGYTLHTCTECGYSYEDNYVYGGEHSFEVMGVIEPTCQSSGYTEVRCSICGAWDNIDYTESTPHDYEEYVVAPTCQTGGYTIYTCRDCGTWYQDNYTDPSDDHGYDNEFDNVCDGCGHTRFIRGDFDRDGDVDSNDAVYLLYHTMYENDYVIDQPGDVDGDGDTDIDDAIHLAYNTFYGDSEYPIYNG